MMPIKRLHTDTCQSTNSELCGMAAADATLPHGTLLTTRCQTAGRGQRGNSWEADPGLNVTMSLLIRPTGVPAADQFCLSEAVALAVAHTVAQELPQHLRDSVRVKWPNDIYVGDRKIAGILIELTLSGSGIIYAVAGIGLNVNQPQFRSGAPNPVSLLQLIGHTCDIEELTIRMASLILDNVSIAATPEGRKELHYDYLKRLWRRDGVWQWRERASGEILTAHIADIMADGHLVLQPEGEMPRIYAFKEVAPVIGSEILPN